MKKSIIIFVILALIILLANWWSGKMISNQINEQVKVILAEGQASNLAYEGIHVNPLFSQISFNQLNFRNEHNIEFHAEIIRTALTYRDFFRLLTGNSSAVFNEISFLSVYFYNSTWKNHNNANEITLEDGFFTFRGNINEALRPVFRNRLPSVPLSLEFDLYEIRDQDLNVSQRFLPGFRQNKDQLIDKLKGRFDYDPVLEQVHLRSINLRAPFADLHLEGFAKYDNEEWSILPSKYNIDYKLNAQPNETRFTLSQKLGQFAVDNVDLQSTASFTAEDFIRDAAVKLFFSEGKTVFNLNRFHFHPSENILQEYGMISQAFGFDLETIYLNRIGGNYTLENDRFIMYDTQFETAFFAATLNIDISLNNFSPDEAVINEGSLRIARMSSGIEDFFEDVEVLFSTEFQRDDDDILIHFRGPLLSPEIIE